MGAEANGMTVAVWGGLQVALAAVLIPRKIHMTGQRHVVAPDSVVVARGGLVEIGPLHVNSEPELVSAAKLKPRQVGAPGPLLAVGVPMIAREVKRAKLTEKYAARRAKLKADGDYIGQSRLPRNSNPNRMHNRCKITGRTRGYMRQFGISRLPSGKWHLSGLSRVLRKLAGKMSMNINYFKE